jgi:hypothetical protein
MRSTIFSGLATALADYEKQLVTGHIYEPKDRLPFREQREAFEIQPIGETDVPVGALTRRLGTPRTYVGLAVRPSRIQDTSTGSKASNRD